MGVRKRDGWREREREGGGRKREGWREGRRRERDGDKEKWGYLISTYTHTYIYIR